MEHCLLRDCLPMRRTEYHSQPTKTHQHSHSVDRRCSKKVCSCGQWNTRIVHIQRFTHRREVDGPSLYLEYAHLYLWCSRLRRSQLIRRPEWQCHLTFLNSQWKITTEQRTASTVTFSSSVIEKGALSSGICGTAFPRYRAVDIRELAI
jgi:hypothetical protein